MIPFINVKYSEQKNPETLESKTVVARGWRVRMEWCSVVLGFLLRVMRFGKQWWWPHIIMNRP